MNKKPKHRTGVIYQNPVGAVGRYALVGKQTQSMNGSNAPVPPNGGNGNIGSSSMTPNNGGGNGSRGGNCGFPSGMGGAVPMSWGSACPPGQCTAADLAAGLGRSFAGEAYPCRELPYWISGVADSTGFLALTETALVTICPTRVLVMSDNDNDNFGELQEFIIGNQNQIVGDPIPFVFVAPTSYTIIPFVTDCIRAGMPFSVKLQGQSSGAKLYFGIIGPAIG